MTKTKETKEVKKSDFKCNICACKGWENLDYLRKKPHNFQVCKGCGFVAYDITQEKLISMYVNSDHNQTRKFSGTKDDQTKMNKIPYHRRFMGKFLEEKKDLSILDFGCSTGYVLNMCREEYGHKDITGIELNPAHAEYGRNTFGIDIHEVTTIDEFKKKVPGKKFDLIICFAVLEHLLDPVDRMMEFRDLLNDGGHAYIMVPLWFNGLLDSEKKLSTFEHLFVPHHINCFSHNAISNTFNLSGFEIKNYCNTMYGHMFLVKKEELKKDVHVVKEDYKKIIEEISQIKASINIVQSGGSQCDDVVRNQSIHAAIEAYPQNPEVYNIMSDVIYKEDSVKCEQALKKAIEIDPSHTMSYLKLGILYFQMNAIDDAKKLLTKAWEMSPSMYKGKHLLAEIDFMNKDYASCITHCKEISATNPRMGDFYFDPKGNSARDLIGLCYAKMNSK